jgi:predicted metal-dependent phosphoesterase TrpH
VIDLHLHTTASDGLTPPFELVGQASAAGLTVMAVTDHDTTAAVAEVQGFARALGIEVVPGIEITAVDAGRDVHMLGYFFDPEAPALAMFLTAQRQSRLARVEAIGARLGELGVPIAIGPLLALAKLQPGRAVGRPQIARAMIAAGHVRDLRDAFDRWLGDGRPAFVPRTGPAPEAVIDIVHAAGGLISLAHPGRTQIDARIPSLRDAGLDAIEVYHCDHPTDVSATYAAMARDLGLLATGGSDYHGDGTHGRKPGAVTLPVDAWERLRAGRARG